MDVQKGLLLATAVAGALAAAFFVVSSAGDWQGVLPKGTTDSPYYYARIHEVLDGHLLNGDAFAYEHRDDLAPAQFVPDIIAAVPTLMGIPFNEGVLFNVVLWGGVFLFLAYYLLIAAGLPRWWALAFSVITYLCGYSFILRPVVMQLVFPAFFLFLIVLLRFLESPRSRSRALWLMAASALAFYTYTFLAYIVFFTLGSVFLWFLITKRWHDLKSLFLTGVGTGVLIVPFILLTLSQMQAPWYLETFARIGMVYTRVPAIEAFFFGRWIVVGLAAAALLWWLRKAPGHESGARRLFWAASGLGLLGSLFLNVATGVELTIAVHIGRFVQVWMPLLLGYLAWECYRMRPGTFAITRHMGYFGLAALLTVVLAVGVVRSIPRGFDFFYSNNRGEKAADIQPYAAPLRWIDANIKRETVIFANDSISQQVPIMTRHYPLFLLSQLVHTMSDAEVRERYLLSRSFGTTSLEIIKRDFDLYAGAGAATLQPLAYNQRVTICRILSRVSPRECPSLITPHELQGEQYFLDVFAEFEQVKRNRASLLEKYHVSYLLVDRERDQWSVPLSGALYDDGRFAVVPL